jgi:hypothetical protein
MFDDGLSYLAPVSHSTHLKVDAHYESQTKISDNY